MAEFEGFRLVKLKIKDYSTILLLLEDYFRTLRPWVLARINGILPHGHCRFESPWAVLLPFLWQEKYLPLPENAV